MAKRRRRRSRKGTFACVNTRTGRKVAKRKCAPKRRRRRRK